MSLRLCSEADQLFLEWIDLNSKLRVDLEWKPRKQVGQKSDLLKRALGSIKAPGLIYDATGGLLRDAHHFVQLGFSVKAFERQSLLAEALKKAPHAPEIEVIAGDFCKLAQSMPKPDVVYLDPMFPAKTKSALSGKESQLLQKICEFPSADEEVKLLDTALSVAKKRVIVKRPLRAPPLASREPHHMIQGKTVRYDVYLNLM